MSGQGVGSISCSLFVRLVYHITVEAAWRGWGSHTPKSQDGGGGGDHAFSKTKESHSFVKSAEVPLEGWKLESSCRFPTQHTCTCIHTHTHRSTHVGGTSCASSLQKEKKSFWNPSLSHKHPKIFHFVCVLVHSTANNFKAKRAKKCQVTKCRWWSTT